MTRIITTDVLDGLRSLPAESVHVCVTSPPYWGLRSYLGLAPTRWRDGTTCCLGAEPTPQAFVEHLTEVFDEVRRVLRSDGCAFVNLGDTFGRNPAKGQHQPGDIGKHAYIYDNGGGRASSTGGEEGNLLGIPWRSALALQAAGWNLRAELVWHKESPMPASVNGVRWERCRVKVGTKAYDGTGEAVRIPAGWNTAHRGDDKTGHFDRHSEDGGANSARVIYADCPGCDRCRENDGYILRRGSWRTTVAHEPIFMLTKSGSYFCDRDAVATPLSAATNGREKYTRNNGKAEQFAVAHDHESDSNPAGANMRSVQTFPRRGPKYEFCYGCKRLYVGPEVRKGMTKKPCPACGKSEWVQHYAAFPFSLPHTLIKAACSEAGCCGKCGAQWARVVETEFRGDGHTHGYEERMTVGNKMRLSGAQLAAAHRDRPNRNIGFRPTCSCRAYRCVTCMQVVQYPEREDGNATQRPSGTSPLQATMVRDSIPNRSSLQGENEKRQAQDQGALPILQKEIHGEKSRKVLQSQVQHGMDAQDGIAEPVSEGPESDHASKPHGARICAGPQSISSERNKTRRSLRASHGDGGDVGQATEIMGAGASQERNQDGQSTSKSRIDDGECSSRRSDVSVLREELLHSLTCPGCGGRLEPYKARPVCLDPFAGTGTTLIAALAHGCEAIGIEASPQYAALAEARLERWKVFADVAKVELPAMVNQKALFGDD